MTKAEIAVNTFKADYNCAQSVFSVFSDELGITRDFALKAATGFGGGMGRTQNICGAVSGGVMVLNMLYGRGENEDKEVQLEAYSKVHEFITAFEAIHGTSSCLDLLDGAELLTKKGQMRFKAENMRELCYGYVRTAVELLESMMPSAAQS